MENIFEEPKLIIKFYKIISVKDDKCYIFTGMRKDYIRIIQKFKKNIKNEIDIYSNISNEELIILYNLTSIKNYNINDNIDLKSYIDELFLFNQNKYEIHFIIKNNII